MMTKSTLATDNCSKDLSETMSYHKSMSTQEFYDKNKTRFSLAKTIPGDVQTSWLFLPGGPGVDSNNFLDLIEALEAPGNYWLMDLIGNGTNQPAQTIDSEAFERWGDFLAEATSLFDNAILIGHSFGGFLPLFCPTLEKSLKGFIILNSVPTLHSPIFSQVAHDHQLPPLKEAQEFFINTPCQDTLKDLYILESFYFFSSENRSSGIKKIINKLEHSIDAQHWWYTQGAQFYETITWIPQKVPTLIIGGSHDKITPLAIFKEDSRFDKENIDIKSIDGSGHFPWLEMPNQVNKLFLEFVTRCFSKTS